MNTNNLSISYSLQTDKMSKVTDARLLGSNHKQSVTMNVNMKSYFGENSSGVIRQVKLFKNNFRIYDRGGDFVTIIGESKAQI